MSRLSDDVDRPKKDNDENKVTGDIWRGELGQKETSTSFKSVFKNKSF